MMDRNADAIAMLRDLTGRDASGELVVAGDEVEVHVHVVQGRIAWATSTAASGNLVSYLLEYGDLDRDVLREVVKECRKTNKRFGETLIEWGVADAAVVRSALAAQIREALTSIQYALGMRTLFLPRNSTYSAELTFSLDEVWQDESVGGFDRARLKSMAADLGRVVPDLQWVEVVGARSAEALSGSERPAGAIHQTLRELGSSLVAAGGRAATLRCDRGALVGRALREPESWLWCGLPGTANLGLAKAVLSTVAPRGSIRPPEWISDEWITDAGCNDAAAGILTQAIGKSDDLVGAVVYAPGAGAPTLLNRVGFDPATLLQQIDAVVGPVRASLATIFSGEQPPEQVRMPQASFHMDDGRLAHFSTSLTEGHGPYLWLVLHQASSPGFGWALLTTLARQLREEAALGVGEDAPAAGGSRS